MNPEHDEQHEELESRLRSLVPAEPGPALRQRIASDLDATPDNRPIPLRRRPMPALAAAAVLALAATAALFIMDNDNSSIEPPDHPAQQQARTPSAPSNPVNPQTPPAPAMFTPDLITLKAALRQSPQALNDLLDRPFAASRHATPTDPTPTLTVADARRWAELEQLQ